MTITRDQCFKTFIFVTYKWAKKLEWLPLAIWPFLCLSDQVLHSWVGSSLLANLRQRWKGLLGVNTLAYLTHF